MRSRLSDFSWQAVFMGLLVAAVGYASSVAVVVQGLAAMQASVAEIATGLAVLSFVMGAIGVAASWRLRIPVSIAWSTPGLALLATTGAVAGGFAAAAGAFLIAGGLIALSALIPALGRAVAALPKPIANGMLAGVLLPLCLAPVKAVAADPLSGLVVVAAWALALRFARLYAMPITVIVAALMLARDPPTLAAGAALWPSLSPLALEFSWEATVSIAVPLYLVTMASQTVPGFAVLAAHGYHPAPRPLLLATGLGSAAGAPFGAPSIGLAAITAALCAGTDAHPDPARRWVAAFIAGLAYVVLAALAGLVATMVISSPPLLIAAVAGLALTGSCAAALHSALADESHRLPALVTFLVAGSGISFAGIGPAFWSLLAGGAVWVVLRR